MKRHKIHVRPAQTTDYYDYDALYDEISSGWRDKADKLQKRRWRALRHQDI